MKRKLVTVFMFFLLLSLWFLMGAGDIYRTWGSQTYCEATSSTYTTLSGTTEEYSAAINLTTSGSQGVEFLVEADHDPTPTDTVTVNVYASLDSGTVWGTVPVYSFTLDNSVDQPKVPFIIKDYSYIRLGMVQSGSTDSHDVRASYKLWNWYYD